MIDNYMLVMTSNIKITMMLPFSIFDIFYVKFWTVWLIAETLEKGIKLPVGQNCVDSALVNQSKLSCDIFLLSKCSPTISFYQARKSL